MGLDNYPVPCPCEGRGTNTTEVPDGLTHPRTAPCPFAEDNLPSGIFGDCCWLRGKAAAHVLDALGEIGLAERMYEDMPCEDAIAFAKTLRDASDRLERQAQRTGKKPRGAGWNGIWDEKTKDIVWQTYSTFEDALAEIRKAASWYEKVGRMGFGVHAWF